MAVKILITRTFPKNSIKVLMPLLLKLRSLANKQKGYISGETLKSVENPDEHLVISTWQSMQDWQEWMKSKDRIEVQAKLDAIIGESTEYKAYEYA